MESIELLIMMVVEMCKYDFDMIIALEMRGLLTTLEPHSTFEEI